LKGPAAGNIIDFFAATADTPAVLGLFNFH
jgi:hypothetical protein